MSNILSFTWFSCKILESGGVICSTHLKTMNNALRSGERCSGFIKHSVLSKVSCLSTDACNKRVINSPAASVRIPHASICLHLPSSVRRDGAFCGPCFSSLCPSTAASLCGSTHELILIHAPLTNSIAIMYRINKSCCLRIKGPQKGEEPPLVDKV